jgi:hypothetical protein
MLAVDNSPCSRPFQFFDHSGRLSAVYYCLTRWLAVRDHGSGGIRAAVILVLWLAAEKPMLVELTVE